MTFWIVTVLGLVVVLAWLLRPLFRASAGAEHRASFDMQVYRDQLAEVEADLARGVLGEGEAKGSRVEVSRRLLAAASEEETEDGAAPAPRAASSGLAVGTAALVLFASFWLYTSIGVPGYPDRPLKLRQAEEAEARANRPSQAQAEELVPAATDPNADPRLVALVEQLEQALESRAEDLQGNLLLADNLGRLGRFADAYAAQNVVIRLKGGDVVGNDYAQLAEFMILATGGYVSPEAEKALTTALKADPKNVLGRYYSAIALAQAGRPDMALRLWTGLLIEGPDDAPWVQLIREQIGALAERAGQPVPEAVRLRGPSAEDVDAAASMSPEERQQLIRSMVAQLSERLASDGGPAEEWARLIRAYGVLGETGQATAIWNEAGQVFAEDSAAMDLLRNAARDAEVAN